ncbi:hypothetical protein CsSME_00011269 [Camellia sinensis var. sinensis]
MQENLLTSKGNEEIDELCDEWVPESLIPPITEEMRYEPLVLESFSPIRLVSHFHVGVHYSESHVLLHWRNMVLALVVLVDFMEHLNC